MSESQAPAQTPPPPLQPQAQHEQCQKPPSLYPYSSDTTTATARPASPFFRHRPLGRAPSPPTWACYEQIPARSELLGSSDDSDSDSGDDAADEDSLSDADADADPDDPDDADADDNSSISDDAEAAGLMDNGTDVTAAATTNGCADGKLSPVIPHPPPARHRRARHRRPPVSALRPILTIQRSQGFVWNQDLFVPPYIKDRYVASTSPPTSMGVFSPCGSTSTSLSAQDYEIEVVEIRVRDGELDDIIP
ncbi:hypothetical protein EI94DRAFT_1607184 [Lactarius quietus]|nr:hypothetical protein EI94DRAFT_1607184 [Lactarius quietus]